MLAVWNTVIVLLTIAGMEIFATLAHKYIMHGWGWGWHRSHHRPRTGWFELNDLYAVVFALFAIGLIALGTAGVWPLQWIGAGMTAYGAIYFIVHDGLVHKRWPFRYIPRRGYLKRLYKAHRLHHAVKSREECVSFGFLYSPPVEKLQATLKNRQPVATPAVAKAPADEELASPRES
ncbi:sterol desaturase family protein [Vreelandella populi]|uniref:Beta-carotene hydroxylase n=1 Tax=Vreelandella populi TaxID=2498858 RepID=A0A433L919_9GAMM|nr:sterol desaturase family protein [Halomonas populi]RUR36943.1 beta-carotene hydroxylase [Halomonas populi]RUR44086.1 beta-carotene hydroxylase [Halomonas populi]RUR53543.1 beta-carotene hydroxylase [Halomonas populi]